MNDPDGTAPTGLSVPEGDQVAASSATAVSLPVVSPETDLLTEALPEALAGHVDLVMEEAARPHRVPLWRAPAILLAVLAPAVVYLLWSRSLPTAEVWTTLSTHGWLMLLAVGLGLSFIVSKGMAWSACAQSFGLPVPYQQAIRVFCESVCVDLVTWPGKLWSDVYKYRMLGDAAKRTRAGVVFSFRLSAALATALVFAAAALAGMAQLAEAQSLGPYAVALLGLGAGSIWWLRSRGGDTLRAAAGATLRGLPWALLASVADVGAMAWLAHGIAGVPMAAFATWYVLIAAGAMVSTAPLGLGVLDTGTWLVLTQVYNVGSVEALAVVTLYRITGPFLTAGLGMTGLLIRLIRRGRGPLDGDASQTVGP
jgi:hypothetical protein